MPRRLTLEEELKLLIEEMGGIEAIMKSSEQHQKDWDFLETHSKEWHKQYPEKWVAVYQEELVAVADDFDTLLSNIDEKNIPRDKVVVEFLTTKRIPLIMEKRSESGLMLSPALYFIQKQVLTSSIRGSRPARELLPRAFAIDTIQI